MVRLRHFNPAVGQRPSPFLDRTCHMIMNIQTDLMVTPSASNGADVAVPNGTEIVSPLVGESITQFSVPNGTDVASPLVGELVKQYRLFAKETAENVLRLAETIVEVHNKLSA